jgi:ribosomal protein L11 methylase PrmA
VSAVRFKRCTLEIAADRYDEVVAALLDMGVVGWQERLPTVTFWLSDDAYAAAQRDGAIDHLRGLGRVFVETEVGGWEEQWRTFHHPVTAGGVTVRPPWSAPTPGTLDVMIDVGMAFGTGSHATTRQCLTVLADLAPGSLLDAGTGTGVLALAAMRLGFAPVFAFDNDPEALVIAEENARRNGLRPLLFGADVTDAALELPHADTVVANITLKPLVALGARYSAALAAGHEHPRTIVLAGLLEEQLAPAVAAFVGYRQRGSAAEGEWHCVVLETATVAAETPADAHAPALATTPTTAPTSAPEATPESPVAPGS